jgi:hypothetical protein
MMAPRLFVMPPLLDSPPRVSVAEPNPELLDAGLDPFGGFEGVEAAGSELPELVDVVDLDDGVIEAVRDEVVDVDVAAPSGLINGVVKPMKWSSVMSFANA